MCLLCTQVTYFVVVLLRLETVAKLWPTVEHHNPATQCTTYGKLLLSHQSEMKIRCGHVSSIYLDYIIITRIERFDARSVQGQNRTLLFVRRSIDIV